MARELASPSPLGGDVQLHVGGDPGAVADAAATWIAGEIEQAVAARGACRLALAGGSTPRATYERLAAPEIARRIDWTRVHVFFGDERLVPPSDAASNYRMASEALLGRVPLPPSNVHRIEGELSAAEAATRYEATLGGEALDVVLLGMGDDGHVASLFPGGSELASGARRAVPSHAPVAPHERVTLSLPVLSGARSVALLVTGAGKAERIREVFDERVRGEPRLPASLVAPRGGALHWFLDAAAAARLPLESRKEDRT